MKERKKNNLLLLQRTINTVGITDRRTTEFDVSRELKHGPFIHFTFEQYSREIYKKKLNQRRMHIFVQNSSMSF